MLKADIATSSKILQQLFNNIWNNEIIPNNWTKGLIYKYVTTGEEKLREEQAGFMKGRGCIDQIFAIIEQCIEWKIPLFINYIDFEKELDSVHRETLWNILISYGIPLKKCTL